MDDLARRFPAKQLLLGEVGWPSAGRPRGGAVPGRLEQARFIRGFAAAAAPRRGWSYNVLEAFDQSWKMSLARAPSAAIGACSTTAIGPSSPCPVRCRRCPIGRCGPPLRGLRPDLAVFGRGRAVAAALAPLLGALLVEQGDSRHRRRHPHRSGGGGGGAGGLGGVGGGDRAGGAVGASGRPSLGGDAGGGAAARTPRRRLGRGRGVDGDARAAAAAALALVVIPVTATFPFRCS